MNYPSILSPLILASFLAGLIATPAHAETYGQPVQDEPDLSQQIRTVRRPTPATPADAPSANRTPSAPTTAPGAATVATAAPVTTVDVTAIDAERWHLSAGRLIREELIDWGKRSGWQVIWRLPHTPTVPADTDFEGSFKDAAGAVIRTLAENGLVIRGLFYDGNRTLLVSGAGPVTLDPQ
jgi:hypothetical protein